MPSPNEGTQSNFLTGVAAVSETDVWAVGYSETSTSGVDPLTMHWDGTGWTIVPTPPGEPLNGVAAVSADDVWAVGSDSIRHWDGLSWTDVSYPGGVMTAVDVVSSSDVWAVGYSNWTVAEHWDGASWSVMGTPPIGSTSVFWGVRALSPTDVWAVGSYVWDDHDTRTLTMRWDGFAWNIVPSPSTPGADANLEALAASSDLDVWAVGSSSGPMLHSRHLSERFDGAHWANIPTARLRTRVNNALEGIVVLAPNDVWTAGFAGLGPKTLTEHWDGMSWTAIASPSPGGQYGNYLRGLAASDAGTQLWAVGYSRASFGAPFTTLIEEMCPTHP